MRSSFFEKKIIRIIVFVVLLIFLFVGVVGGGLMRSNKKYAIKVGKIEYQENDILLNMEQLSSVYQQYALDKQKLKEMAVKSIIENGLILNEAQSIGFVASEWMIHNEMKKLSAFSDEDGNFNEKKFFKFISSRKSDYVVLYTKIKRYLLFKQLYDSMNWGGDGIIDLMSDLYISSLYSKRVVRLFDIKKDPSSIPKIELNDALLEEFYNNNIDLFKKPEIRKVSYSLLNLEEIKSLMSKNTALPQVTEKEIKEYYDSNLKRRFKVEKRKFIKYIFKNQEDAVKEYNKLRGKSSLEKEELRQKYGKDIIILDDGKFILKNDVDLSDTDRDHIFSLNIDDIVTTNQKKSNRVSRPIKTRDGWVLFELNALVSNVESFDKVKIAIRNLLIKEKTDASVSAFISLLVDNVHKFDSIDAIRAKYGISSSFVKIDSAGKIIVDNFCNFLGYNSNKSRCVALQRLNVIRQNNFVENVFKNSKKGIFFIDSNNIGVIYYVDEVIPASYYPFKEVKKNVEQFYIKEQREVSSENRLNELYKCILSEYNNKEDSFIKKGSPNNLSSSANPDVSVSIVTIDPQDTIFQKELMNEIMSLNKFGISKLYQHDRTYKAAQLLKIIPLEKDSIEAIKRVAYYQIRSMIMQMLMEDYINSLKRKYTVYVADEYKSSTSGSIKDE